jgi:hypothetical protein
VSEERIMDRIQKLVDKAMSTEFEPEQQALLQKADALMMQYSIDQMQLNMRAAQSPGIKGQEPELRQVSMYLPDETNEVAYEVRSALSSMFSALARHYHIKLAYYAKNVELGCVAVVGYPSDIDFLEMMFVQLKMHMVTNLDPKVDVSQPWVVSVANLKTSGRKWDKIHEMMQAHPGYPRRGEPWSKSCGLTMYGQYKKFVEKAGLDYVGTSSPENWRSDFIAGYVERIQRRLLEMRSETVAQNDMLPALFRDKDQIVLEAYYEMFPEQRPHPDDCQCQTCKDARRPLPVGRRRSYGRVRYRNGAAMAVGGKVANSADLSASGGRVSTAKKGELR